MNPFQYVTASSPDEAASLIGKNGRYLGGGIDLLDEMKGYIVEPDVLVNVTEVVLPDSLQLVPVWRKITAPDLQLNLNSTSNSQEPPEPVRIASFCTVSELAADERVKKLLPGVVEAANEIGSPQIRNVATLAGNLLQHSRCWYYRQPDIVCLKRGGDMCHAQNGENKYHSLFTGCSCISPSGSDSDCA
jgi:xanthine dehydrogenase YagS FAD-binding subunit